MTKEEIETLWLRWWKNHGHEGTATYAESKAAFIANMSGHTERLQAVERQLVEANYQHGQNWVFGRDSHWDGTFAKLLRLTEEKTELQRSIAEMSR